MAPELASGESERVGFQTDVYLLGAILYQILSGHPPHHGNSLLACIHAAANNEIRPTEAQGELVDVAMKAMSTRPEDRYVSVVAFFSAMGVRRTHQESERLVRRAKRSAWDDQAEEGTDQYDRFGSAQTLLHEALALWPDNHRAKTMLRQGQLDFARTAAHEGDLDLALRLYGVAGASDSEAALRVRRDRDRREKVRESQAKFSALFTYSPEAGLLIRWSDGVVMEANETCLEMLGYEKEEIVGRAMPDLAIWACPNRRQQFIEQLGREGRIDNFECQFVPQSVRLSEPICDDDNSGDTTGAKGLIDVLISSRTVEVGGEEMLLSTIRDISKRREAERDLEQSRRRLRDLQRLAGLGTWAYDPSNKTIQWSAETYRITGRSPDKGPPGYDEFMTLIHPDDRAALGNAIAMALQTGASYQVQFRQKDDVGVYRKLHARGQPVIDKEGNTTELYGVLTPVNPAT